MASISSDSLVPIHATRGSMGGLWVEFAPKSALDAWIWKRDLFFETNRDMHDFKGKYRMAIIDDQIISVDYKRPLSRKMSRKFTMALYHSWRRSGIKAKQWNQ